MSWFETLMGFPEVSPDQVRENCNVDGNVLKSRANGRELIWGHLDTPSLAELRSSVQAIGYPTGKLTVREIISDAQSLHADTRNAGALFQVASQFNLLEMVSPFVTPEKGVGIYEGDRTQGPACAVSAGAGTIYRNYFAPVNGQVGQTADNQIDCLADLGDALGNAGNRLWKMANGYALPSEEGLAEISQRLSAREEEGWDGLRKSVRIGIQGNTQVTLKDCKHTVTQVYCSALPVAYSNLPISLWSPFARLVLEAAYEATFCAAILNSTRSGNKRLFLTQLGGGAFGNEPDWIMDGVRRALELYRHSDLDVAVVSYGSSNEFVRELIAGF